MKKENPWHECPFSRQAHVLIAFNSFGGGVSLMHYIYEHDAVSLFVAILMIILGLMWGATPLLSWWIERQEVRR